ncbi:MAG: carboxypeptidase M32 [Isosphaeraceae bacterium]
MSIDPREAYDELIRRSREQATLASCSSVLGWDEQTYMPAGGAGHRGSQMALLAGLHHERATDPRIGDLLASVEESSLVGDAASAEAVNVRELRRGYDRRVRLPRALVEELARTTSMAQSEWVAARAASDFGRFRPWLEKIIQLKREESTCLADGKTTDRADEGAGTLYDPLLEDYEPGARSSDLAVLFDAIRRELTPLVATIAEAVARKPQPDKGIGSIAAPGGEAILRRCYPRDRQRVFGEAVAAAVGFDFRRGRLDVTAHPFCSGIGPGDCRITTRFDEHEFGDAFFGILHEVGHGLYEQGLEEDHYGTPMGDAVSLGVHESQSRLWENLVGRSRSFWAYWLPLARRIFREALADVTIEQFHAAVNHVVPSLIRVRADEATYNLHIIIRFELEKDLLTGALPVGDLPGAWNQKYRETLGVTPGNDAEGCLQDIHWSAGLIGYFPTYTLGNVYAAQLYGAAQTDLGLLDDAFTRGDFNGLLSWLREKVHRQGQRYRSSDLIERVTGTRPDHRPLIEGLRRKYSELYGI